MNLRPAVVGRDVARFAGMESVAVARVVTCDGVSVPPSTRRLSPPADERESGVQVPDVDVSKKSGVLVAVLVGFRECHRLAQDEVGQCCGCFLEVAFPDLRGVDTDESDRFTVAELEGVTVNDSRHDVGLRGLALLGVGGVRAAGGRPFVASWSGSLRVIGPGGPCLSASSA